MNPFELEAQRQKVLDLLSQCTSCRQKLVVYNDFFNSILISPLTELSDTYFLEFFNDYSGCMKEYSPLFMNPEFTSELLRQLSEFKERFKESFLKEELDQLYNEFKAKLLTV